MNGKGDSRRPFDREKWEKNYDRIFEQEHCKHPGCKCHITHPCEECGYQGGQK